jgi:hypothetical protein
MIKSVLQCLILLNILWVASKLQTASEYQFLSILVLLLVKIKIKMGQYTMHVALLIQHKNGMCRIVTSFMVPLAPA